MTEPPNDATTPLSRMRFSWQRGHAPAAPPAPPEQGQPAPSGEPPGDGDPPGAGWSEPSDPPPAARTPGSVEQPPWSEPAPARTGQAVRTAAQPPVQQPVQPAHHPAPRPSEPPGPQPEVEAGVPRFDPVEPPRGRERELVSRRERKRDGGQPSGSKRRKGTFDVPPPGGRFSGGRGTHTALRAILLITTCLLALAVVAYVAFSFGLRATQGNTYELAQSDIERYQLTEFPTEQAGQFAADFVRLCLSHSMAEGAAEAREQRLRRYVSGGADPTCGWNGTGTQVVHDSTWTGASEPIDIEGYDGKARMMTVRALTSSGSEIVTVPVYVEDVRTGAGMRIVGDIGEMPQPVLVDVPNVRPNAEEDSALADALSGETGLFTQFFTAWGASDEALLRLVTPDATAAAKGGLDNLFTDPVLQRARVFLPEGVDPADEFAWETGDTTEAWVWVTWRSPNAGDEATETRAYRLQLVKTANASNPGQEWAVRDVRGGVPDVEGN